MSLTHVYIYSQDRETELPFSTRKEGRVRTHALITVSLRTFALRVSSTATHVSTYIVKTLPAGPCRLEKTLSPAISSGRCRTASMQIAAGPAIRSRCPLDHDRQRALFSKFCGGGGGGRGRIGSRGRQRPCCGGCSRGRMVPGVPRGPIVIGTAAGL